MKFRKKPEVVEAVQWNGENLAEVRAFLGVDILHTIPGKFIVPIRTNVGEVCTAVGDWLVKDARGAFLVYSPANMLKLFETFDFEFDGICGCCGRPMTEGMLVDGKWMCPRCQDSESKGACSYYDGCCFGCQKTGQVRQVPNGSGPLCKTCYEKSEARKP